MTKPLAERFWAKVARGGPDDCWIWRGSKTSAGYGNLASLAGAQPFYAHRLSYEFHSGPIPRGMFVLHRCDNPACVNPNHLFLGTQTDNMRDMSAKGRSGISIRLGEANHRAKLTAEQVAEIRNTPGPHSPIAKRFGITRGYVSNLKRGEKWAHTYQENSK
jgi:HNH endonuclease